jgi:hypothetical protein
MAYDITNSVIKIVKRLNISLISLIVSQMLVIKNKCVCWFDVLTCMIVKLDRKVFSWFHEGR